jgi:hypothetical protein
MVIPYMMLQVLVDCNQEAKLIFVSGVYHHFLGPSSRQMRHSLRGTSGEDLIGFATRALEIISTSEDVVVDGLVRVDLFKNNEGNIVVNEFESLEARYFSSSQEVMMDTERFLTAYWESKIYLSIKMYNP